MTGQLYDLLSEVKCENTKELISRFLQSLFMVYRDLYFTYMELYSFKIRVKTGIQLYTNMFYTYVTQCGFDNHLYYHF